MPSYIHRYHEYGSMRKWKRGKKLHRAFVDSKNDEKRKKAKEQQKQEKAASRAWNTTGIYCLVSPERRRERKCARDFLRAFRLFGRRMMMFA